MTTKDSADHYLKQALSYYEEEEDFDKALEACDQAIETDPYLADAHNLRGLILEELDQPLRALSAYKEAVFLEPDHAEAQANLSELRATLAAQSELVTIVALSYSIQAQIVRARLEAGGVWSFVADETADTALSHGIGGVRVQVKGEDVEKALEILDQETEPEPVEWDEEDVTGEEEIDEYDGPEECPRCSSDNIRLAPLSNFLIPFLKKEWQCQECGHTWKE